MSRIVCGDALIELKKLPDSSVNMCVTSPPYYGLRDYGVNGQIGLSQTPDEYVASLVDIFREVRRVMKADGTLWLNIGDTYAGNGPGMQGKHGQRADRRFTAERLADKRGAGIKKKDLIGIPWMLAFALRADGWYLRQDIIWNKSNTIPESVRDRCTKSHEYIFLLSKSPRYYFDQAAIKQPIAASTRADKRLTRVGYDVGRPERGMPNHQPSRGGGLLVPQGDPTKRNRRSVWTVATQPYKQAHFAVYPPALIEPPILAGCPVDGVVLDPFFGSGTTGIVARQLGRDYIGIELNPEYVKLAEGRIALQITPPGIS